MSATITTPVSSGDLSKAAVASGTLSGAAQDNGIVIGSSARVGDQSTNSHNLTASAGGTINVTGGAEQIAALSGKFTDALEQLSHDALSGSKEQTQSLAQSLRDTFDTALASVKELAAAQQSGGLTTAMKFVLGLAVLAVIGWFAFGKKKS